MFTAKISAYTTKLVTLGNHLILKTERARERHTHRRRDRETEREREREIKRERCKEERVR